MNNKFKKIMAASLITMTASTAIGCATTNTKIANKINNGVDDFVSSINKLDYVETNTSNSNLGKIVSALNESNLYTKTNSNNIENSITRPSDRPDNFKLFILSESPYVTLTSDDNNLNLNIQVSTEKIETTSDVISEEINKLILKRAILMIYVNEIHSGNVNLTDENRRAITAYVNIIKENASYLNGNRGMVKNQLGMASNLLKNDSNDNIVNYYIIKSGEALEIRSNKITSTISAMDSIISILEQNLLPSSCYYTNNLSNTYNNIINNANNLTTNNENEALAKNIAETINLLSPNSQNNLDLTQEKISTYPQRNITSQRNNETLKNNEKKDCIDCKNQNSTQNLINNQNYNIKTLENNDSTIPNNQTKISDVQNSNSTSTQINPTTTPRNLSRQNRVNQNLRQRTLNQQTNNMNNNTRNNYINKTDNLQKTQDNNLPNNRATRVPYKISNNINE